jgi:hypothetical protein
MLHCVALVQTDVSEECITSIIRVTRTGKLGTLAVTSNQSMLPKKGILFLRSVFRLLFTANTIPRSPSLSTQMMETIPLKHRFLQGPHGVTSQKTEFSPFYNAVDMVFCIKDFQFIL